MYRNLSEHKRTRMVSLRLEEDMLKKIAASRQKELDPPTLSAWVRRTIKRELIHEKKGRYGYDQRTGESTAQ